ncbi:MAG: indole-3-glycerol phosphate synthase TrpC [Nitrospirae bacterium]|nr:MAG: indole-3-glycerol phosphate synthase TrpC [Nitrospirota bacterium]
MSVLDKIVGQKKERVAAARLQRPAATLRSLISDLGKPRDFRGAIIGGNGLVRLIAEIKKASPSRGLIRPDFDHKAIATVYEEKKVDAISVLTEEDFFQGNLAYLPEVSAISSRPLLRKDFIFDEYQIYEARAAGADAILLIAAILGKGQAGEYLHLAQDLGMAVLFEVHDHDELEMALRVNAPIIGINNRNLKTLQIDLGTTFALTREIPAGIPVVSESGISSRSDVMRLAEAGVGAMLIGSSLMAAPDIAAKIDELRGAAR